jgi:hypothetical protein
VPLRAARESRFLALAAKAIYCFGLADLTKLRLFATGRVSRAGRQAKTFMLLTFEGGRSATNKRR